MMDRQAGASTLIAFGCTMYRVKSMSDWIRFLKTLFSVRLSIFICLILRGAFFRILITRMRALILSDFNGWFLVEFFIVANHRLAIVPTIIFSSRRMTMQPNEGEVDQAIANSISK